MSAVLLVCLLIRGSQWAVSCAWKWWVRLSPRELELIVRGSSDIIIMAFQIAMEL